MESVLSRIKMHLATWGFSLHCNHCPVNAGQRCKGASRVQVRTCPAQCRDVLSRFWSLGWEDPLESLKNPSNDAFSARRIHGQRSLLGCSLQACTGSWRWLKQLKKHTREGQEGAMGRMGEFPCPWASEKWHDCSHAIQTRPQSVLAVHWWLALKGQNENLIWRICWFSHGDFKL